MYAIPFPAIDPIALEFGPLVVRWYSLAYILGLILGWRYALILVSKFEHSVEPLVEPLVGWLVGWLVSWLIG